MDEEKEYLLTWAKYYLNSRDQIFRTIEEIKEDDHYDLCVKHKNKEQFIIAEGKLDIKFVDRLEKSDNIFVVTFNTKDNFIFLVNSWQRLAEFPLLTICFINPESLEEKKWIIKPHFHSKISEKASHLVGLKSMYGSVEALTPAKIQSIIKQKQ